VPFTTLGIGTESRKGLLRARARPSAQDEHVRHCPRAFGRGTPPRQQRPNHAAHESAHYGARHYVTALAGHTVSAISDAVQSEAATRGARHTAVALCRFAAASRSMLHNVSAHYGAGQPISAIAVGNTGLTIPDTSDAAPPETASCGARRTIVSWV
jgi:hypothetical protein